MIVKRWENTLRVVSDQLVEDMHQKYGGSNGTCEGERVEEGLVRVGRPATASIKRLRSVSTAAAAASGPRP